MSTVGRVSHADEEELEEEPPGLWGSFGAALRLIVGWFCVAIGVLNLIVEFDRVDSAPDGSYLMFHGVILVGGVLLVSLAWIDPHPGFLGYFAFGAILLGGTVAAAVPRNSTVCCMTAFDERHGYPFTLVARDAGARWHIDSQHFLADLMFWGYLGFMVLLVIALTRRVTRRE
jgi:hypothetical protein